MRSLLLRDWRLYRTTLILPFSFCLLWAFIPYMILANTRVSASSPSGQIALVELMPFTAIAATALMASLRVHGINLLEIANGTLLDLLALPIPRARLVQLRLLEGALLTLALLPPVLLEGMLILRLDDSANPLLPSHPLKALSGLGWILLFCLALPLPFTLRWGQRGLVWLGLSLMLALSLNSLLPAASRWHWITAIHRRIPEGWGGQMLLLLLLAALAYGIGVHVFQRREA